MKKISRRNFLLASGAVTIGAALAACGGSSASTSTASSAPASSAAASGTSAAGKVLNIWCWNDEFQSRFNDYYPEVSEIAADKSTTTLKDGTTVKWTINANENNNYQNKLDEALLSQDSAADDDKIDIFLIEADYALKYVDSDYVLDVKADIGLTDSDLAGQYQYTKDIVTVDGSQRGTTWQATPGLFAYRRSIAKDVLGTDDPTEVQAHLSDWDKFNDVAAQASAKGYKMLSGFDDAYRTFSNNVAAPWVDGTTVTVDENIMKWVEQTKEYTDKGYNNKSSLWDSQWAADQGPTGKVFGFFYSTWGINFTLLGNSLETPVAEGGKEEVGNGIYGDYAVCEGPQPYYWGGTWICGAAGSDNIEIIRDVMQKLTCDEAIMKQITHGYAGLHQQREGHGRDRRQRLQVRLPWRPEPYRPVCRGCKEDRYVQRRSLRSGPERELPDRIQGLLHRQRGRGYRKGKLRDRHQGEVPRADRCGLARMIAA